MSYITDLTVSHYLSTLEILQPYTKPLSFSCFASDFQKTYIGGLAQERHNSVFLALTHQYALQPIKPKKSSVNGVIIGSFKGLLPVCPHAITWNSDDFALLIVPWGTNFSENLNEKTTFPNAFPWKHYDVKSQSFNPGLQYPHLHGPVHTPDNNRWDTPPV